MEFKDVNSKRKDLNSKLARILSEETNNWGVEIVRVELKDITPPRNVQDIMNSVINAENAKRAAIDMATARETEADGLRRAKIKEAEGEKQACILKAEGQAKAFDLINKSFTGNAQILRQLEVTENSLRDNTKIILSEKGITPQLLIGNLPVSSK
jgi:regulator of protease activity HflC (stomatin/prohibitin superfamily)